MPSQLPGLALWSCYNGTECGDIEEYNFNINTIAAEHFTCVTATDAATITNDASAFTSPQPGDAYVDAAGCKCVYLGPDKGWVCNPPLCGRIVFDPATNASYIWDGAAWKQLTVCETVTSNTIVAKGPSVYPSGTLGYNDTTSPYVEFITINGVWVETGRFFDPATCDYFECEDGNSIFFSAQPASADPNKPEPVNGIPTDKYSIYGYGDSLWTQSATGDPVKLLGTGDQLVPCYADGTLAEAGFDAICLPKQDGLLYFDTTLEALRICKGGVWVDAVKQPECVDAFLDNTQAGLLTKLNADGKLDPNFICQYPCYDTIQDFEAAYPGSPVGGQRFYNKLTGRVEVYDAIAGVWRDEAEAQAPQCLMKKHILTAPAGTNGPGEPSGPDYTFTTAPFNTTVYQTGTFIQDLGADQYLLKGDPSGECCYEITMEHSVYFVGWSQSALVDVATGNQLATSINSFSNNLSNPPRGDISSSCLSHIFCPLVDTVVELQVIVANQFASGWHMITNTLYNQGQEFPSRKMKIRKL